VRRQYLIARITGKVAASRGLHDGRCRDRGRQEARAVARAVGRDPALTQPWLRTLVTNLSKN
jgi:hypothetical protein